jgi:hypothetical protein
MMGVFDQYLTIPEWPQHLAVGEMQVLRFPAVDDDAGGLF